MPDNVHRHQESDEVPPAFLEADDPLIIVDLHDAKLLCRILGDSQSTNRQVRIALLMVLDHFAIVHLVDVVTREDHNVFWTFLFDRVDVLVYRISRALIPLLVDSLLGWDHIDELA